MGLQEIGGKGDREVSWRGGGFLHFLGSAGEMVLASETLNSPPPHEMGMIMTAPCIQAAHRSPHQHASFPPFLIPSSHYPP